MNLDEEELITPNRQADITPPGERVGEHVETPAKVFPDLMDTKLSAEVLMAAIMQLALAARAADVVAWEEMTDLSEEGRKRLRNRLPPGQARFLRELITADQPKTQMPKPAKPQSQWGGDRRNS